MKKFTLRKLLLIVATILILLGIGYKYYEWNTIKQLSDLYNSGWKQEFKIVEAGTQKGSDFFDFYDEVFGPKSTNDSFIKNYDELKGKLNIFIENEESYLKIAEQNKVKYSTIKSNSSILMGQRGNFVKNLTDLQLRYLDNEIENMHRYIASLYLQLNLLDVFYDKALSENYDQKMTANKANLSKNFSDISPLQSYTNSDFKFNHEDEIKKYLPEGYAGLQKYKEYLSTYYLVVQDIINGDLDSASYKYTTIANNVASLTLNYKGLFGTGNDERINKEKAIVEDVSNGAALIKNFKKNNLGKYPVLPEIKIWKEDLVLCQMYDYKSVTIYNSLTSKYPTSKNFDDLLKELSNVNPKTDFVDKDFDKSIVTFTNDDKKIEFQCKDNVDGDTLTFSFTKK
ncbi:MAG: hypothetical protein Q7K55_02565 [Candidatus Levybacteria bacterium]|nr:hypothetical protein [Candidatus Levybacteria bacterium]